MKTHPLDEAFGCPDRTYGGAALRRGAAPSAYPTQLAEPESVNV